MKKFTVFLKTPDADPDDPPYWAQVTARDAGSAVFKTRKLAAADYDRAFGSGFLPDAETFPLALAVDGWPYFRFELED